jgi:hypothetical protein
MNLLPLDHIPYRLSLPDSKNGHIIIAAIHIIIIIIIIIIIRKQAS